MIRRPPRSTRKESSAASDVYKRQPLTYSLDEDRLAPYPTGVPSGVPTVQPTSQPTSQPTAKPTSNPTSMNRGFNRTWAHGIALDLQSFRNGEGLFFTGEYTFTNIGVPQLSQYGSDYSILLTIDVYDSGFGPVSNGQFLEFTVNGEVMTLDNSTCLLYTSPSPRDQRGSRMPSSA